MVLTVAVYLLVGQDSIVNRVPVYHRLLTIRKPTLETVGIDGTVVGVVIVGDGVAVGVGGDRERCGVGGCSVQFSWVGR